MNRKLVSNSVEVVNILQKEQVVELVILSHLFMSYFLLTDYYRLNIHIKHT